jgi:hypothetical protein
VNEGLLVDEAVELELPPIEGSVTLVEWRPFQYCLKFQGDRDADGLIYALTFKLYKYLKADIFGLSAYKTRKGVFVSIYLNLPINLGFEEAKELVEYHF